MKSRTLPQLMNIALLMFFLCDCSPLVPAEKSTPLPTASSNLSNTGKNQKITPESTSTPDAYPAFQSITTPAPYPAQRPIKPTPFFTQTPEVHWNTDTLEFNWPGYDSIPQPEWLNNTTAKLASLMTGSSQDYYFVDISAGKDTKLETILGDPNWKVYSPSRTYAIECKDNLRMLRVKDNSLVSEFPISLPDASSISCSTFIQWAPDESAAGFLANDLSVFIWKSNGAEPAKVFDPLSTVYTNIAWSPDSQKMAFVKSMSRLPDGPPLGTAVILDRDGQFLYEVQVQLVDSGILGWLTNNVLESLSRSQIWFYDISSGDLLFSWKDQPTASGIFHQRPRISPDERWVFIDQGDQSHDSTTQPDRGIVEKQYSLFDIQTKTNLPLLSHPETYLLYAGWNADRPRMYVISRPAESTSESLPTTPFGLLAF